VVPSSWQITRVVRGVRSAPSGREEGAGGGPGEPGKPGLWRVSRVPLALSRFHARRCGAVCGRCCALSSVTNALGRWCSVRTFLRHLRGAYHRALRFPRSFARWGQPCQGGRKGLPRKTWNRGRSFPAHSVQEMSLVRVVQIQASRAGWATAKRNSESHSMDYRAYAQ
jgi:hypothetical protein